MMHIRFYIISILFLLAVGACFLLIAFGDTTNSGIAANSDQPTQIDQGETLTNSQVQQQPLRIIESTEDVTKQENKQLQ